MKERWENPQAISIFEQSRRLISQAFRANLREIFTHHVPKTGTVLEIGCGTGALRDRVERRMIHLDSSVYYLKQMKFKYPGADVIVGDADNLQIPSDSIDSVVALSAFDTFDDPLGALRESYRVLEQGGKFVHMLDLIPNPFRLIQYFSESGKIPFPSLPLDTGLFPELAWKVADVKKVEEFLARNPKLIPMMRNYLENFRKGVLVNGKVEERLARQLEEAGFPGTPVAISHLFAQRLTEDMRKAGFVDVRMETFTASTRAKREECHAKGENRGNVFINCVGSESSAVTVLLPNEILQISVVQCVTGKKK